MAAQRVAAAAVAAVTLAAVVEAIAGAAAVATEAAAAGSGYRAAKAPFTSYSNSPLGLPGTSGGAAPGVSSVGAALSHP